MSINVLQLFFHLFCVYRYTMVSTTPEERKMFRVTPMHYVIFDEAHMLKNMNTQRYETLVRIKVSFLTFFQFFLININL